MHVVVTGAAGFIGSHLTEALLAAGDSVVGVDCFTDYYDPARKRENLAPLLNHPRFRLVEADLQTDPIEAAFEGAGVVYHLAGQPGVRLSWSTGFADYLGRNVAATQRVLEAATLTRPARVVYASSSSIYGNAVTYPTTEDMLPAPHSPYGVTKLAGEHLCHLYAANRGIATTTLRYFTVYGPRQRPDMGMHRFIEAARSGAAIPVFGDGEQVRDFTYVGDVVAATLAAARDDVPPGTVANVAGGASITVNRLLEVVAEVVDREVVVQHLPDQPGDVRMTAASIRRASELLDWAPRVGIVDGLTAQADWQLRDAVRG